MTADGLRMGLGNLQEGHDKYIHLDMNGGRVIGVEGTINPEGYLNSIAFYEAHKGLSFGAGIGVPFNWDSHDVGEIVRINGSAGDLLDAIQVHFAGGQSTPYIGGDEGEEFDIDFSEDPLSQITFRAVDHGTLLSVEFIKESGESLRVGDKTDS